MHSSPWTPTGHRFLLLSSTRTTVLKMGFPTVIPLLVFVMGAQVDQTVVSVGPYIFHNSTPAATNFAARSIGKASPPTSAFNEPFGTHPASKSILYVEGVPWINEIRCSSMI